MNDRRESPLAAWAATDVGQVVLRNHALRNIEIIRAMPRCGAKARSTGLPCQQPGSGRGGRCHYHGGKSTAGETWGQRQWSNHPSPVVARRQATKAEWVERTEAERAARLAAMTPDERARYNAWLKAHMPGSQDRRVEAKLEAAFAAHRHHSVDDMSVSELEALINELRAEKQAWEAHRAVEERIGVFG